MKEIFGPEIAKCTRQKENPWKLPCHGEDVNSSRGTYQYYIYISKAAMECDITQGQTQYDYSQQLADGEY